MTPIDALKKTGQILSKDLAKKLGTTERTLAAKLFPHTSAGHVMACRVFDGEGRLIGTEYRISGTIPAARPGPKVGRNLIERANEVEA